MIESILFYGLSGLAVLCAASVIMRRNPITSAIFLMSAMISIAAIYALLEAHFVFVTQILIYTSGIVVVIIFAIMLLNLGDMLPAFRSRGKSLVGVLAGLGLFQLFCFCIFYFLSRWPQNRFRAVGGRLPAGFGSIAEVGKMLITNYVFVFEALSLLILAAMLGVVVLTRRRVSRGSCFQEGVD
jgi:NADH-quinone oxidoreductase subunit J